MRRPHPATALRRSRRRRLAAVASVLALVGALMAGVGLGSQASTASAAKLTITARAAAATSTLRCASTALTVTSATTSGATTTAVSVTGLTAADLTACSGRTLTLWIVDAGGNQIASATTSTLSSTVTLPASFTTTSAASALVDVGGFGMPTTWKAPVVPGGGSCGVYDVNGAALAGWTCTWTKSSFYGFITTGYAGSVRVANYGLDYQITGPGGALPAGATIRYTTTLPPLADWASPPTFSWATAGVISTTDATARMVSSCSQLPTISFTSTNIYQSNQSIQIAEDYATFHAANPTVGTLCPAP